MRDLIDRASALDAIKNAELGLEYDEVEKVPIFNPWHRVEDELPKKEGKYLVCWKDGGGFCYDTAWWTSVGTWSLSHWTGVTVTHWMPVEPPKEEA